MSGTASLRILCFFPSILLTFLPEHHLNPCTRVAHTMALEQPSLESCNGPLPDFWDRKSLLLAASHLEHSSWQSTHRGTNPPS
jgi:hypothetical protein